MRNRKRGRSRRFEPGDSPGRGLVADPIVWSGWIGDCVSNVYAAALFRIGFGKVGADEEGTRARGDRLPVAPGHTDGKQVRYPILPGTLDQSRTRFPSCGEGVLKVRIGSVAAVDDRRARLTDLHVPRVRRSQTAATGGRGSTPRPFARVGHRPTRKQALPSAW